MPDYEIQVAGPIGPVVASSLPGFTSVTVPSESILTGTVACLEDLRSVIELLTATGLTLSDVRTTPVA